MIHQGNIQEVVLLSSQKISDASVIVNHENAVSGLDMCFGTNYIYYVAVSS